MSKKRRPTVAELYDQLEASIRRLPAHRQRQLTKELAAMSIQTELREAVKKSGVSHYRLAKDAGITPDVIDRFVRKERDLRLGTAAKLAEVLGLRLTAATPAATPTPTLKAKAKAKPKVTTTKGERRT